MEDETPTIVSDLVPLTYW